MAKCSWCYSSLLKRTMRKLGTGRSAEWYCLNGGACSARREAFERRGGR